MNAQPSQPEVVMYCSEICPFCTRARRLLKRKGVDYREIRVDKEPERSAEMKKRGGGNAVPQIFIGDKPVGGFDDLVELDLDGELDPLLGLA